MTTPAPVAAEEWWVSGDNVLSLAHWLRARDELTTASDAIHLFEKPWKWTQDWRHHRAHPYDATRSDCATCNPPRHPEDDE